MSRANLWRRKRGLCDDRALCLRDRQEIAACLWSIRKQGVNKKEARAFCWAVLANFKTGLAVIPRREESITL